MIHSQPGAAEMICLALASLFEALQTGDSAMLSPGEFEQRLAGSHADFRLRLILEHARSHLHRSLSLPELAKHANVSVWHVCRLFRRDLGVPPLHCIKMLRLRSAATLLATSCLSVKEVMASVGINDESHFVKDFKAFFGESPLSYRASAHARSDLVNYSAPTKIRQ